MEAVSIGLALQGLGVSREKLLLRGSTGVLEVSTDPELL